MIFLYNKIDNRKETWCLVNTEPEKTLVQTQLVSMIYLIYSTSWHGGGAGAVLVKSGSIIKQKKVSYIFNALILQIS